MFRVSHFELHAKDPARAAQFYADVFGWRVNKWDGPEDYWLLSTGRPDDPGINGGIKKAEDKTGVINTIRVPSLDEYVKKVIAGGGSVVSEASTIPGVGRIIYCKDTEGIVFGMMESAEYLK